MESSEDPLQVRVSGKAEKELRRLGPAANRIRDKIRQYAADPESLRNNVSMLKNRRDYRLRIGDYRVIFQIRDNTMIVLAARKRGEAYD